MGILKLMVPAENWRSCREKVGTNIRQAGVQLSTSGEVARRNQYRSHLPNNKHINVGRLGNHIYLTFTTVLLYHRISLGLMAGLSLSRQRCLENKVVF